MRQGIARGADASASKAVLGSRFPWGMRFRRFPHRFRTVDEFYDSNRRRNRRSAWSLGYWHDEQTTVHMSWLETTGEVFVIEAPDLDHGPVEVLARLPSVEAVEAILDYPNGDDLTLWRGPTPPRGCAARTSAGRRDNRRAS
jgi:hypothetical protein